jgi:hypothetical protein
MSPMSRIAFCPDAWKVRGVRDTRPITIMLLTVVCVLQAAGSRAEDAMPPPPLEPKPSDRPPQDGPGRRPGPPRGGGMPGTPGVYPRGDREHTDAFNQLPEEERQRIRAAFEKVWNKPDVVQARDRLMKANEAYREVLHQALGEADSGVLKILEKVKVPMPGGGFPFAGRLPDPNDSEFSKKLLARLSEDLQNWARNEKRDLPVARFHERVVNAPAVRELVTQLDAAQEPQRRLEIAGRLREAYFAAWRAEFGQARDGMPRREGSPGGKPERREAPPRPETDKP